MNYQIPTQKKPAPWVMTGGLHNAQTRDKKTADTKKPEPLKESGLYIFQQLHYLYLFNLTVASIIFYR